MNDFDGDLDDYKNWLATSKTQANNTLNLSFEPKDSLKNNDYTQSKADRQALNVLRRPIVKETEQIEKKLTLFNTEKTKLDARAGEASLYDAANKDELQSLLIRQSELGKLIDEAELRWLQLHDELENLGLESKGLKCQGLESQD